MTGIVLDQLLEHLRSKDVALEGQERPVAILWTDPKEEWKPLLETLLVNLEELLVLGNYDPARRTGPAIWIRCLVDRVLKEPLLPEDRAPILYLPGVSRQDLRAGEECPDALRPLVELLYRGCLWIQQNGKDWGLMSFLGSKNTINLDISRDQTTFEALSRALPEVAVTPLEQLQGRRLEADDFDRMLSDDVIRDVLRWLNDPEGSRARLDENRWGAFRNRCQDELDFDPDLVADVSAGEYLGKAQGAWKKVWDRFEETPPVYENVGDLLYRSRPAGELPFERERWPDLNDEDEESVRKELLALSGLAHLEACQKIKILEKDHGHRRSWVWARLKKSPLAMALEPLSRLAEAAASVIGGASPDEMARTYLKRGWQADAAAWEVLSECPPGDESLLQKVVSHLLHPWLDDSARSFQEAIQKYPLPGKDQQVKIEPIDNQCLLFADGLRIDLGLKLQQLLEGRGLRVQLNQRWAACPTVTATAKPAVTPARDEITGQTLGEDFAPSFSSNGEAVQAKNLREALEAQEFQILGKGEFETPLTDQAKGWLETGHIDTLGHQMEARLARQIPEELERLSERVLGLLNSGWKSVRIVTDHGWLFLPGGLPKVDLPKHLTESRWARCAVIAGASEPDVMKYPWYWNSSRFFATPPGCACFNKSPVYAHGGLSLQECFIPDLLVEHSGDTRIKASIETIDWKGLRCIVEARADGTGIQADLRLKHPGGTSVISGIKPLTEEHRVSLLLEDDEHLASELILVLLDGEGNILAHQSTQVGSHS